MGVHMVEHAGVPLGLVELANISCSLLPTTACESLGSRLCIASLLAALVELADISCSLQPTTACDSLGSRSLQPTTACDSLGSRVCIASLCSRVSTARLRCGLGMRHCSSGGGLGSPSSSDCAGGLCSPPSPAWEWGLHIGVSELISKVLVEYCFLTCFYFHSCTAAS